MSDLTVSVLPTCIFDSIEIFICFRNLKKNLLGPLTRFAEINGRLIFCPGTRNAFFLQGRFSAD